LALVKAAGPPASWRAFFTYSTTAHGTAALLAQEFPKLDADLHASHILRSVFCQLGGFAAFARRALCAGRLAMPQRLYQAYCHPHPATLP